MPNPSNSTAPGHRGVQPPAPGFTLDDAYYVLFRHKWLLLGFTCLGIISAVIVHLVLKPNYVSVAKVQLSYVMETAPVVSVAPGSSIVKPDDRGANLLNSEVELLTSRNVAEQAVALMTTAGVKPADLLSDPSGVEEADKAVAASVILSGLAAAVPKNSDVITVSFKHQKRALVQPVLNAIITAYQDRHLQVHGKLGLFDTYYSAQRDELKKNLRETEMKLNSIMTNLNLVSYKETRQVYVDKINELTRDMIDLQKELLWRKRNLGEVAHLAPADGATNAPPLPDDKSSEYTTLLSALASFEKQKREATLGGLKPGHPTILRLVDQIAELKRQKAALEQELPGLIQLAATSTNVTGLNLAEERARIAALNSRLAANAEILNNLKAEAGDIIKRGPEIAELEQKRDEQAKNFELYSDFLRKAVMTDTLGLGRATSFSIYQNPTPPMLDSQKLAKLLAGSFGGFVALGLALSFGWEMVFNNKVRRLSDVERNLRLPLFLSIPDLAEKKRLRLPWMRRNGHTNGKLTSAPNGHAANGTAAEVAVWDTGQQLAAFTEALRDRLITYFEVNNLTHKPKLVAVTSCGKGAGVTSLASGLAAALSETGDGNVLLVDMNLGTGAAHQFYKGKPTCGIADVLQPEARADAQVQENLYVATVHSDRNDMLPKVLPKRFMHLVPKLKASDYDYIIFDMPPVTQTSVTARLSGHMDMVLMVLESEKTGQQLASRANALLSESRANVAAVLNKCRRYVPAQLAQEL